MKIGLDLDQTIYPFVMAYREMVLRKYSDLPRPLPQLSSYGFFLDWGITNDDFVRDLTVEAKDLYKYPPFYEALTSVPRLAAQGHDIYIVTARVRAARALTFKWVEEWFGDSVAGLVIGTDKTVLKTDIFLDDAPKVIESLRGHTRVVIMDQPYNRHMAGERVQTIYEFETLVLAGELARV